MPVEQQTNSSAISSPKNEGLTPFLFSLSRFYALESLQGPYTFRFPLSNQDQGMNDVMNKSLWF